MTFWMQVSTCPEEEEEELGISITERAGGVRFDCEETKASLYPIIEA